MGHLTSCELGWGWKSLACHDKNAMSAPVAALLPGCIMVVTMCCIGPRKDDVYGAYFSDQHDDNASYGVSTDDATLPCLVPGSQAMKDAHFSG